MCKEVNNHLQKMLENPPAGTDTEAEKTDTVSVSDESEEDIEEDKEPEGEDSLAAYSFGELIRDSESSDCEYISDDSSHVQEAVAPAKVEGSKCPVCDAVMSQGQLLSDHLKTHYSEEVSSLLLK